MPGVTVNSNVKSAPLWMGDFMSRDHLLPFPVRVDPDQFADALGVRVTTTAGAAIGATTLAVTAISAAIPRGTVLYFGEAGEFARLSADAAAGATSLAVDALIAAIESGDSATYSRGGQRFIRAGTLVGRTYAERDAGTSLGAAVNTDDEFFILAFDIPDATVNDSGTVVRPDAVIKENYLPDWTAIAADAALLAKLRATYRCIKGES